MRRTLECNLTRLEIIGAPEEKMNVSKWSQENKHALRDLYARFLEETKVSFDDFVAGRCVSYSDFQDYMYSQTKYAVR